MHFLRKLRRCGDAELLLIRLLVAIGALGGVPFSSCSRRSPVPHFQDGGPFFDRHPSFHAHSHPHSAFFVRPAGRPCICGRIQPYCVAQCSVALPAQRTLDCLACAIPACSRAPACPSAPCRHRRSASSSPSETINVVSRYRIAELLAPSRSLYWTEFAERDPPRTLTLPDDEGLLIAAQRAFVPTPTAQRAPSRKNTNRLDQRSLPR